MKKALSFLNKSFWTSPNETYRAKLYVKEHKEYHHKIEITT